MKMFKKLIAFAVAFVMMFSLGGCGGSSSTATIGGGTAWAAKIDGYEVRAGIYIFYCYSAYSEAITKVGEGVDTGDDDALKACTIASKDFETWVKDKATDYMVQFVATQRKFDELGLEISAEDQAAIDTYVDNSIEQYGDIYKKNGIGEESVRDIITLSFKQEDIFNALYDDGGSEGYTEDDFKDFYKEYFARVKYMKIGLTDAAGAELDAAGKTKKKDLAEDYLSRLNDGEEFDSLIEEYNESSVAESESAVAATGTDENGSTTTPAETTTTEEETTIEAETTAEDTASVGDDTSVSTLEDETADESAETTTVAEDESSSDETTTTANPYQYETVVSSVTTPDPDETTEEGETTTEPTYAPSEKTNKAIFNDAEVGVPFIVEDDDAYYVIERLDITERMTEDDLWTEDQMENVKSTMFYNEFMDKLEEWAKDYNVERNNAAYKRYDMFKLDFS